MTITATLKQSKAQGKGIFTAAFAAVRENKRVIWIPAIASAIHLVIITISAIAGAAISFSQVQGSDTIMAIGGFVTVLAMGVVHMLSNAMLMLVADQIFSGGNLDFGAAFAQVRKHFWSIVAFGIMDATVGALMRSVRKASNENLVISIIAGLLTFLAEVAWAVATYFALPEILFEGKGPIAGIKSGSTLLKQKWPGAMYVNVLASAVFVVLWFAIFGGFIGGIFLMASWSYSATLNSAQAMYIALVYFGGLVALGFALAIVQAAIFGFAKVAIYRFAKGQTNVGFENTNLAAAFRDELLTAKKSRKKTV